MRRTLILTSNRIDSKTIVEDLYSKATYMDRNISVRSMSHYFNVVIDNCDMIEIEATFSANQRGKKADILIMTQDYFNRLNNEEVGSLICVVWRYGLDNIYIINPDEDNDWLYEKLFFTS